MLLRVLMGLVGVVMAGAAIIWLIDPATAARQLEMQLLTDGTSRSTQIGDFTAFFASTAIMVFIGLARRSAPWLQAAGLILLMAAVFRTTAWLAHGAAFAPKFIAVELLGAAVLMLGAAQTSRK